MWGPTKLIYKVRIFKNSNEKNQPNIILFALPASSLHCNKNLRLNKIVTPRSFTLCMHFCFMPHISLIYFRFLVPTRRICFLFTVKDISHLSFQTVLGFCLILPGDFACRGLVCVSLLLPIFLAGSFLTFNLSLKRMTAPILQTTTYSFDFLPF